jgi:hypothetical protein
MYRKTSPWLVILLVAGMGLAGCVDNNQSVVIQFMSALDEECTASVQSASPYTYVPSAELDVALDADLAPVVWAFPQIGNYLRTNFDPANQIPEAFDFSLERVTVTYEFLQGRENPQLGNLLALEEQETTTYVSSIIPAANTSGVPGLAVVGVELIPLDVANSLLRPIFPVTGDQTAYDTLARSIVLGAHVQVHGTTSGGVAVSSNDFLFPINFCFKCLVGIQDKTCNGGWNVCLPGQVESTVKSCN